MLLWTPLVFILIASLASVAVADPCVPRDFGHSSFVCVCNSTYCDTYEKIEGMYELYSINTKSSLF